MWVALVKIGRMEFIKPPPRLDVKKAGKAVINGSYTPAELVTIQEWRDSHAYLLNTFQSRLRIRIKKKGLAGSVIFVQRLKKLQTILHKLISKRADGLVTMHDLAGCRLIFDDIDSLREFRKGFNQTRARHTLTSSVDGVDKYDYITNPKNDGYRGLHDVFKYKALDDSNVGAGWNDLRIEVQYRTKVQHAWATAVEISDIIGNENIKFDKKSSPERVRLFLLASEYMARTYEGMRGALDLLSDDDLKREIKDLEGRLKVFGSLRVVTSHASQSGGNYQNYVLEILDNDDAYATIKTFKSAKEAIEYRNQREIDSPNCNVVFVRGKSTLEIQNAYRNYFKDAKEFLSYMRGIT